ncbi:class I SAM-dependent methyltransferase [Clostridium manihotivorum]|uniref:Class I SAM-dependent methyltransferase n=1 Tax=Clostridium manihotivorum TaxID=2320868 RepID=A0A410DTJ2_9CLOT|nr:class I SAM-dependent methyltransferase [Clostridium manihotivorum]QAA32379.1 class I SAM-dependent methyltransferase [Clostridium manihotivorum]
MANKSIHDTNKNYWDNTADEWFGVTALPTYGVQFITEDELNLFGDVSGKKLLDIGCGSGHSLKYHGDHKAAELWGLDMSTKQIENADKYLKECGYSAKLINAPMEVDAGIPLDYFDYVYSIYAVGWATDLQCTFDRIASYLKKDGVFIFSWKHPLHHCVIVEDDKLIFDKSYFDESWFTYLNDGFAITLCNRKIPTYINALAKAGFVVEYMAEETDKETMLATSDLSERSKKAKMLPLSFVIKARKL